MNRKFLITFPSLILTAVLLFTLIPAVVSATGEDRPYLETDNTLAVNVHSAAPIQEPSTGEEANSAGEYDVPLDSRWQEVDNEFKPAIAPWDWQMLDADYHLRVKENFTAGQIIEFEVDGSTVQLQPMGLEWSNNLAQIQPISMPQDVVPIVTNPEVDMWGTTKHQGTITWNNAYGSNIDFEWKSTQRILNKTLTIESLSDLPAPQQYIVDGGEPFLRLNLIFDPSIDTEIYVDGNKWDKATKVQTFEDIEFRKDGERLWSFMPLMYWDSAGNEGQSVATLEKSGNKLYISVRVPYSWLQTAVYPVFVDADVTIDAAAGTTQHNRAVRGGVFWTSPTVGYVIYINVAYDLVYRKTANGGATWGAATEVVAAGSCDTAMYVCYADWQTDGDAGTKIHIAYMSKDTEEVRYVYLDTNGDSVGGDDVIETCQGAGTFSPTTNFERYMISITKTRGGNLAVAGRYRDTLEAAFNFFYTSPDAATWTSRASPYEAAEDICFLFPANLADDQDVWGAYWDADADEISLKTFDDSADAPNGTWSAGTLISGSMAEYTYFIGMDGAIRLSDEHLILAAWSAYNTATADLMTWDINGEGSITAKTNVITNTAEYALVSVFINQDNDDIYVAYVGGTDFSTLVKAFYQKSDDGGGTWSGSDQTMQADGEDDMRWISAGAVKATWGGKFQPVWFNDDLDDLFTNADNGISIAAAGVVVPTVVTNAPTSVEEIEVTLSGNITATGGENATAVRFQWGTNTGVYTDNRTAIGNYGVGEFTDVEGTDKGEGYFYVASANNSAGWGYGSEVFFITKPDPATNFASTDNGTSWISLSWTNGAGMDYVEVRYAEGSAPSDNVSGTLGYWGSGTSANITGLNSGTTYFFAIFTHATENSQWSTSDNSPTCQDTTDSVAAPTVVTDNATSVEETTATLSGNITDIGSANATARRFQWGTNTGNYTDNWTEYGDYGIGVFTHGITALTEGEGYYYIASANNSAGWGYGSEVFFITKPNPATSFVSTDNGTTWISLSWTNGTGMDYVEVRYDTGSAPSDNVSGSPGYWGSGTSANVTGLSANTTYFFIIFTHATENSQWSTSDNNPTCQDTTDIEISIPTVVTNAASLVEETTARLNGEITNTGGENATDWRFQWGTSSGVYTDNYTSTGDYGVGVFFHDLTLLDEGEGYFYIASANNSEGWGAGNEVFFITNPDPASSFTSTDNGTTWITLSWSNGTGMDYVEIRYDTGSAPTDNTSGSLGYWGSGTSANVTGLSSGTTYFFIIFTHATENSEWSTADDNPSCQDTTDSGGTPTVITDVADNLIDSNGRVLCGADLHGNVTVINDTDIEERGFAWSASHYADPGNTAPEDSLYSGSWTELGSFSTGTFEHTITGLTGLTLWYFRACAYNGIEWAYGEERQFFVAECGKVYIEIRPDLDETRIRGNAGIPTDMEIGIFNGYSMALWNQDDEELYFLICVPDRWDEESDILIHMKWATSDNESGNICCWELAWDYTTPNMVEAIPTDAPHTEQVDRAVASELTYAHYQEYFILDYNLDSADPIISDDTLALRIRRIDVNDSLSAEPIIFEVGVLFARGDFLANPTGGVTTIIDSLIAIGYLIGGISMILFTLAILALGLTIAMFHTRNLMLGFPCAIFWAVLGGYSYTQSTVTWDWQYFLFFASMGMVIFCLLAMYALRTKDLSEPNADEEAFFDEKKEPDLRGDVEKTSESDEFQPSERANEIRRRADRRRLRKGIANKMGKGEY